MSFENLPGVQSNLIDGNFTLEEINRQPIHLILGYSSKGPSESFTRVTNPSEAAKTFGYDGNLVRGLFECYGWGGKNFRLWRYGGSAASLTGIGADAANSGITITTLQKDADAGEDFRVYWDNTGKDLYVWDDSGYLVYHKDFDTSALPDLDSGVVVVTGDYIVGEGSDLGTAAVASSGALFQTPGAGFTYTAGTDGTEDDGPSFMEKFEHLYRAFKLLENEEFDYVIPMDIYLDVPNIADDNSVFGTWSPSSSTDYPHAGGPSDALGKVYVQEYNGEYYFWWDIDDDGQAEIYPSEGSASATTDINGDSLSASDFREVNFAYMLANFCFEHSQSTHECVGTIGTLPPLGLDQASVIQWIGKTPTYSIDGNGDYYIAQQSHNGSGLLGNKFMAGKYGYRSGVAYGGFVLTEDGFPTQSGSSEVTDANDHLIDLGKYISIVPSYCILNTPWDTTGNGYITAMAAAYAGYDSSLPIGRAATNQQVPRARLPFRINLTNLDRLSKMRYVMVGRRTKGIVWIDAPTATRPDSDYQRQMTVRTVKSILNDVRLVLDPFIGSVNSAAQRAAMKTQIDSVLSRYYNAGLKSGQSTVFATQAQELAGEATVQLKLVPELELRQIIITLSLSLG